MVGLACNCSTMVSSFSAALISSSSVGLSIWSGRGGHQGWSSFWGECCIIILASREDFILRCGVDNRLFSSHRTYSRRTKEVHPLVSRITILPKLELDSMSSPIPQCQTTDTVVAEWQTSCETHRHTILFQILRSVLTLRQHKQAQPTGKRLEKSTLAASTLAYCVFVCTNPNNSE